jgi:glycosyltransferase involved in cell wall biosynthesis
MPIKVLHVTFDMTIGGAQQVIRQLVENMDKSQFEMDIACIDGRLGELGEMLIEQGVKVELFERQIGFDFNLIRRIRRLVKTGRYQIIHCHQYTPYVYGLLASLFTGVKVIFTEHGRFYPDYGSWKRKLVNPIFSLFTNQIIAISQATKDALVHYENFSRSKIIVIYNGIADMSQIEVDEIELKKQFGIPESVFLFGTISRLQPIKNQSMMIKAFKKVKDKNRNTHLLIVGDGEIRTELEALVTDLELEKEVTFTGFQKNPYRFHKIIDVFLLTSFSEGASMTLLEAMSFSTPCIVTDVGGNPELVKQQKEGIVINPNDGKALVSNIETLLNNEDIVRKMSQNSRQTFLLKFTVNKMASSYVSLYKKVICLK